MENKTTGYSASGYAGIDSRLFTPTEPKDFHLVPCTMCTKENVCKFVDKCKENAADLSKVEIDAPFSIKVNCEYSSFASGTIGYRTSDI